MQKILIKTYELTYCEKYNNDNIENRQKLHNLSYLILNYALGVSDYGFSFCNTGMYSHDLSIRFKEEINFNKDISNSLLKVLNKINIYIHKYNLSDKEWIAILSSVHYFKNIKEKKYNDIIKELQSVNIEEAFLKKAYEVINTLDLENFNIF